MNSDKLEVYGCSFMPSMRTIQIMLRQADVDFEKNEIDLLDDEGKNKLLVVSSKEAIMKVPQLKHNGLKVIGD